MNVVQNSFDLLLVPLRIEESLIVTLFALLTVQPEPQGVWNGRELICFKKCIAKRINRSCKRGGILKPNTLFQQLNPGWGLPSQVIPLYCKWNQAQMFLTSEWRPEEKPQLLSAHFYINQSYAKRFFHPLKLNNLNRVSFLKPLVSSFFFVFLE